MERIFLGLDKPPLHAAADHIVDSCREGDVLDLSRLVLVLPGARASRRLTELLFHRAQQFSLRYLPGEVTTAGNLPELLYQPKRPFATDWVQQLSWSWAIRNTSPSVRDRVFPAIPSDAHAAWSIESWLQLGRMLRRCYRELASEGLSFASVVETGPQLDDFTEESRWTAMAVIQEEYLRILDERNLWDRQTARMVAVDQNECHTSRRIVLIGVSDLNRIFRKMLEQVGDSVVSLVAAPEEWSERFDGYGCVKPAAWAEAEIPLEKNQLIVADNISDQANAVVNALARLDTNPTRDQITISCPDPELVPYIQRALANHDINGRWGMGRSMQQSEPYQLLDIMCQWLRTNRFDAFAVLLRHPDVDQWLLNTGVPLGWLNELDNYRNEHLPVYTTGKWLGSEIRRERLEQVWKHIAKLSKPLRKPVAALSDWADCIMALLDEIYGGCNWNLENQRDRITFGAANAINRVLLEQCRLPRDIATSLDAAQAIELVLEQVADQTVPEVADPNAVEIIGWLDAFLEDSEVLILTGMNEGVVPTSEGSDTFLPNSLRELLDLNDNCRRYARDAYALKSIVTLYPRLPILAGRRDVEGNPRVPSRLLFAADNETISQRWLDFFQATESITGQLVDRPGESPETVREFQFQVPRPTKLSAPIEKMRPTDFKLYLECPYRFYLKRVLRYRSIADDETEMTGGVFGDVAHEVLNKFGRGRLKNSTNASEIYADLAKRLTAHCRQQFGPSPGPAVRIQIEQLKIRFYEFSFHQARWAKDYEIAFVEEPTDKLAIIETPAGTMSISGRIDRIDRHRETGEYVILDYKTSDGGKRAREAHQGKNGKEWKDLQLPIYRHLAKAMDIEPITNIGYIILSKKLEDIQFDLANWTAAELASADEVAAKVVENVLAENFWPPGKAEWADYDDYRHVIMEGILERGPLVGDAC